MKKRFLSLVLILSVLINMNAFELHTNASNDNIHYDNPSGTMYCVSPHYTVDAFKIVDSNSYGPSYNATEKTIYVENKCTLEAADQVEIGITKVVGGTTLEEYYKAIWDEVNFKYIPFSGTIESYYISTMPLDNAPKSIQLDEGTYIVRVSKGGDSVFTRIIIGSGESPVSVYLNDKKLDFDVPPVIEEGRTLVPLRALFEAMGMTVNWDSSTSTITATSKGNSISMRVNETTATVNGKTLTMDIPPKLVDGRTLVPVRFISESFGAEVKWDREKRIVYIYIENLVDEEYVENMKKYLAAETMLNGMHIEDKIYDRLVTQSVSKDVAGDVITFFQNPIGSIGEALYSRRLTSVITDALINDTMVGFWSESIEHEYAVEIIKLGEEILKEVNKTALDSTTESLKQLRADLDIDKIDVLTKSKNINKISKSIDAAMHDIELMEEQGENIRKNVIKSCKIDVACDYFDLGSDIYSYANAINEQSCMIKALYNVREQYIDGLMLISSEIDDKHLSKALDDVLDIMRQEFDACAKSYISNVGQKVLESNLFKDFAIEMLKKSGEKILINVFKVSAEKASVAMAGLGSTVTWGMIAGKATVLVCDLAMGTAKSVESAKNIKLSVDAYNKMLPVLKNYSLSIQNGNDCFDEYKSIANVILAMRIYSLQMTNAMLNADENNNFTKLMRQIKSELGYDESFDDSCNIELNLYKTLDLS
ncbi:MAG: copper amine oxidase N-terminal domain-containing protein [Clostridia bacterium]|nr:copper amine oxidase N-terminal domain-containing protein [Clostridia bacterium]